MCNLDLGGRLLQTLVCEIPQSKQQKVTIRRVYLMTN